jgi:hypothetical protein
MHSKIKLAVTLFLIVAILFVNTVLVFANNNETTIIDTITTTLSDLINPLIEKLVSITIEDITNAVNKFTDMVTHWSREYVGKLNLLEIIAGYGDGRFGPEDTLKVDEFLKMTLRAMGHKVEEGMDYWAEPYIKLAKEEEITEDNEFTDYRRPILREEAARIIVKAALKIEEVPIPNHVSYARLRIPDYNDIGDEYKQEVLHAYSMGFITGVGDGRFLPKKTLTRGEGSAIIMRYLDKDMRKPMRPKDNEIVVVTNELYNKTYEIYPPSKPEVIDVIRVMKDSTPKSKGYSELAYNTTDELIFSRFYKSNEAYEESSIFKDCSFSIRMAEWELSGYDITIFDAKATKELHRDVFIDLLEYLLEDEAERAIKDLDHILDLAIKRQGIPYMKEYILNDRKVIVSKRNSDDSIGMAILLKGE